MQYNLSSLDTACSKTFAGIFLIEYAPVYYFASLPKLTPGTGIINQSIDALQVKFKDGYDWLSATVVPRRNLVKSEDKSVNTEHGQWHEDKIGGTIVGDKSTLTLLFQLMVSYKYIVRVTDNNGNKKIIGTQDSALGFSFTQKNDGVNGSYTGYEIEFAGKVPVVAFYST